MMEKIRTHRDLKVFQLSFEAGMDIFHLTKSFPKAEPSSEVSERAASGRNIKQLTDETYSLTDQIRRSSRSVSGNLAEAFRKRKYPKAFVAKLSDSEGEAAETQVWLDYSLECKYIDKEIHTQLNDKYDHMIAMLVSMSNKPENWSF